tara:strand:- start:2321 stop:2482 length:162 start_codon:yes stop_codon:yes gene_type:complete
MRIKTRTRKHLIKNQYYVDILSYDNKNNCDVQTKTFYHQGDAELFVKMINGKK